MTTSRPLPVADETSVAFWEAAAQHVLAIARCSRCAAYCHPPDVVCPQCHDTDPRFTFEPVAGRGRVCSWIVMHQSFLPGFEGEVPFVLVDVALDLDGDVRLIGRLLDGPDALLTVDAGVTVAFEEIADGVSIPAFRLDTPA